VNPYNQHLFTASDIRLSKVNPVSQGIPKHSQKVSLGETQILADNFLNEFGTRPKPENFFNNQRQHFGDLLKMQHVSPFSNSAIDNNMLGF
jgi:hypothetical protein